MATQWLDRSPAMLLAACTCGWRVPVPTNVWGWQLIVDHAAAWHTEDAEHLRRAQQNRSRADLIARNRRADQIARNRRDAAAAADLAETRDP